MPDAALQVTELVAEPHDARADVLAVAGNDPVRVLRGILRDSHPDIAERIHRHRPDRLRIAGDAEARDSVAVEQGHDDARLDVGGGREDNTGRHYSTLTR